MKATASFLGGMNDYAAPEYLEDTQYVRGVNGYNRGGHWQTRPDITQVAELPAGRFQGLFNYRDTQYAVIAGQVYRAPFTTPVDGITFSALVRQCYATETEHHLILSDGAGNIAIVGDHGNRMLGADELPSTGPLVYGQGRVFFTDRGRTTLMAGDIYQPGEPDTPLGTTEQQFLNEGLFIRQPAAMGKIQAMQFMRMASGTGVGALVVFHEHGACMYAFSGPRAGQGETPGWLDSQIGQVVFKHDGCGGPWATLQVNNDLFYRDATGLATFRSMLSQSESATRTFPISMPIYNTLVRDAVWTLDHVSGAAHDNRLIYTHGLRVDGHGDFFFDSLVAVDMLSFYAGGDQAQVTFDGLWLGAKYLQVLAGRRNGRPVLYIATKGVANRNYLSVLKQDALRETPAPRTRLYTKKYFFDTAFMLAKLDRVELWLENLRRDATIRIFYRGESGIWYLGGEGEFSVPYYTALPSTLGALPQARNRVSVPFITDVCDPLSRAEANRAGMFQFCIEMRGAASLTRVLFLPKPTTSPDAGITLLCASESGILLTNPTDGILLNDYDELTHSYYDLEAGDVKYI